MDLNNYHVEDGFYVISPFSDSFSKEYLALRKKENRILSNEEVQQLPRARKSNPHYKEWKIRQKTTRRFITYLLNKKPNQKILDIGCGNGWFSNKMAINNNEVIGLDVNRLELKQAVACFKKENLDFAFSDLFTEDTVFHNQFNIITLNASVQYFKDFGLLINQLKKFLKPKGEIHILDSPFYVNSEIHKAKKRTLAYYTKIGFPKMAQYYFHHSKEHIMDFDILYKPKSSLYKKILRQKDSPFMWVRYNLET